MNDGEIWAFLRRVLAQGAAINQGHLSGLKWPDFEEYSRKLDDAARERTEELARIIKKEPPNA